MSTKAEIKSNSFRDADLTMADYLNGICVGRTRDGLRVRFSRINTDVPIHSSWRVRSEFIGFESGFYHDTEGNFFVSKKDKKDIISFE